MSLSKQDIISKIHLVISVVIVVPVALVYGFNPGLELDIHLNSVDEQNFFKAVMGLYLGFSVVWVLGILKANYLKLALITNVVFMLGLGFGRLLSLFINGTPSFGFQFGTLAELFMGVYGLWVLRTNPSK